MRAMTPITFTCNNVAAYLGTGLDSTDLEKMHTGTLNGRAAWSNGVLMDTSPVPRKCVATSGKPFAMRCEPSPGALRAEPAIYVEQEYSSPVCVLRTACGIWEPSPANQIAHFLRAHEGATFWLDLMQPNPLFVRAAGVVVVGVISTTYAVDAHVADALALDWGLDPAMQTVHRLAAGKEMAA